MTPAFSRHKGSTLGHTGAGLALAALLGAACCAAPIRALATPAFAGSGSVYATGREPADLATGDLNGDGRMDLVAANSTSQSVSILLTDAGDGFQSQVEVPANVRVDFVRLADTDRDGNLDILSAGGGGLFFIRGHGDGGFDTVRAAYTGIFATAFAAADVDGDGRLDAVVGDANAVVAVFWGRDDATFEGPVSGTAAGPSAALAVLDADADGNLDVVTAAGNGTVSVLFGAGGRTFRVPRLDISTGASAGDLAPADVDRDGDLDLLLLHTGAPGSLRVLRNPGSGNFASEAPVPVGSYPASIATADLDQDGILDAAVTLGYTRPGLQILQGTGSSFVPGRFLGAAYDLHAVVAADLNADGREDLAATRYGNTDGPGNVVAWLGMGNGQFPDPPHFEVGSDVQAVMVADFNGDAQPDVAVAHEYNATVDVRLCNGDGTFGSASSVLTGYRSRALATADVNRDGDLDLLVANTGPASLVHPTVVVLLGNGDGTFRAPGEFRSIDQPHAVCAADFNQDAILDLAVAGGSPGAVSVLLGRGDGTFGFKTDFPTLGPAYSLDVGDLDRDGALDLVAGAGNAVCVLLGRNDGTFGQALDYFTYANPTRFARLADLDADGVLDAVCAGPDGFGVILRGRGDGALVEPGQQFPVTGVPLDAALADFDQDGTLDVAVACTGGTAVLAGDAAGNVLPAFQSADDARYIRTGDFNSDGKADLLIVTVNGVASVLRNVTGETAVWIESFTAARTGDGVQLAWRAHGGTVGWDLRVERAPAASGPYEVVSASIRLDDHSFEWIDTTAPPSGALFYRLVLTDAEGVRAVSSVASLDGVGAVRTALDAPRWDGAHRSVTLRYSIRVPGAMSQLAVVDVRGRLLWKNTRRFLAPGTYLESWDGRVEGGAAIPHGMYFVRLESGARTWTRKLVRSGR